MSFDIEEFKRIAEDMQDVPLGDVVNYVLKQQVRIGAISMRI